MNKFENVDIFASLDAIMRQNTGFFQSDFDIDKEIIAKAAASPNREDKTLLWFCRPSGTHCFKERDVFLKDTAAHNTSPKNDVLLRNRYQKRTYIKQGADSLLLAVCALFFYFIRAVLLYPLFGFPIGYTALHSLPL